MGRPHCQIQITKATAFPEDTNESIIDQIYSYQISPTPCFFKEGNSSFYEREGRQGFRVGVYATVDTELKMYPPKR